MADAKTTPNNASPAQFLAELPEPRRREQGERVLQLMAGATGDEAVMWGPSMIGFGSQHYVYASGREGDWPRVAFSPRKTAITFYGLLDHEELQPLRDSLGTFTTGKGCLYVKKLQDVDEAVLTELVRRSYELATGVTP